MSIEPMDKPGAYFDHGRNVMKPGEMMLKYGPTTVLPALGVTELSTSGFSSGAFFSNQLQMAYSDVIKKVGVLSGGPWAIFLFLQSNDHKEA
jgi:hypothetical protein